MKPLAAVFVLPAALLGAKAPAQDEAPRPTEGDLPVVKSRADFMALDRDDRWRFSRARRPPVSFFVEGGGEYSFPTEVENTNGGELSTARVRGGGGLSFRLNDDTDLVLRGEAEFSFYDFDDAGGVIPPLPAVTDPIDDTYQFTFAPIVRSVPEEGWHWFVGGRIRSAGEPDADFGDTLIGGGLAGASYDVTDTLRLGLGVNVNSRLEGGIWAFPVPIIEWDITDNLSLQTRERGLGLEYWLTPSWSAALVVGFERHEFRLSDDSPVPEGSINDRRIPVTFAVTYSPSPRVVISGRVGSEVWGEIEFNGDSGSEISDAELDPSILAGLDLRIAF